jgi:imidazolonepropionase-like amidohydrolase
MQKQLTLLLLILTFNFTFSQDYFPTNDGIKFDNTNYTTFTNAKIYSSHNTTIENGSMVVKDGKIVQIGKSVEIPKNSTIIDLEGKSIYPSFIDIYSKFGVKAPERKSGDRRSPQYNNTRKGYYWNDHIRPEQNAIEFFKYDDRKAKELIKNGFGAVNTHLSDGIIRGKGVLIALTDSGDSNNIIDDNSTQYLSLSKSVTSSQSYPSSIMGVFALLKQVYFDAEWYSKGLSKTNDKSLEALNENKNLIQIFEAKNKINSLRIDKIGDEFDIQYVLLGGGDEYERIEEIKATNASYILPVNFPDAYDVEDIYSANILQLSDMREWNQKPTNPSHLEKNNIVFAITLDGLKSPNNLKENIIKAIDHGLTKEKALEALTSIPAKLIGRNDVLGYLKKDYLANFLITSGEIFDNNTVIYENWVKGNRNIINSMEIKDIRGKYKLTVGDKNTVLDISGKLEKPKAKLKDSTLTVKKLSYKGGWLNMTVNDDSNFIRISLRVNKENNNLNGKAYYSDGSVSNLNVDFFEKQINDTKKSKEKITKEINIVPITYPNMAYGFGKLQESQDILIKNTTVWTNEIQGVLKNTDVLITKGKISKVGINLKYKSALVIDGTGKHLTSGIIDEHSHIAASSINEGGHNSSAEVTIEEVIDPEDINIYRNLAGGVTTIQILHGSANPIGGRSAIIKLKWGENANNLIFKNSPKFIKFALGENVKQSNWQSYNRFPQSRMGVEQLYVDYFTRAKEYDRIKKSGNIYRKDLELEVLAEILNKQRFISCHSYVQSEINMLMKVAEKFNFKINTFTHILEGYKVADKMKEHGVGASTFSDWWAYKFEVNDAIPYNASILHNAGVTTAINSDDAEMSRRLNQEAAKTIKYGGLSEEDAWKTVTLNPAKLLRIDDKVGSIKIGKDADVVLWNQNPLSVYAIAEKTIIDGAIYFDKERDKKLREEIKEERNLLINMMMEEKNKGGNTQPVKRKFKTLLTCESI